MAQKYFPHDCINDSLYCRKQRTKGIWWKQYHNKTATRQRRDSVTISNVIVKKINTPLSLPIIVEPLPPPSLSPIIWMRRLSSADASVVVVKVFEIISLSWCLCCCRIFLGTIFEPPAASIVISDPLDKLSIPWPLTTPVIVADSSNRHRRRRFQVTGTINTPPPPQLETFTWERCLFCFLCWRLCCSCWVIELIFLCQHLHCCHDSAASAVVPQIELWR